MHGFGISKIDEEARVLAMEFHDFFIVNIYAPNAQLGLARLPYRNEWDALLFSLITELHVRKPIILCGDFNVAHRENDVGSNYINSNFPGCSKLERDNFDKLLSLGFTDVLRVCESTEKLATWWPYTAPNRGESQGLRFDYILASGCLTDKLIKSEILRDIFGSDHCPILAEFELDFSKENIFQPETKQVQCRLL